MSLESRLKSIDTQALNNQNWVKYIYSLIDSDFQNYKNIFWIEEWTDDEIKDQIYLNILNIFNEMQSEISRVFWISLVTKRKNDKPNKPEYLLGWVSLELMWWIESTREGIKTWILWEKSSKVKKTVLQKLLCKENQPIEVSEEEIDEVMTVWHLQYIPIITNKWIEILDWYLKSLSSKSIEELVFAKKEQSRMIFGNIWD